jgi:hypothetical protein
MELLGIRVQRNFCSLGGGSARKEKLWREYIYRSCLDGDVVRGILVLARSSRESGGLGGRVVCDAAGCLARVVGVGELLPATVTGAGGLWEYFFLRRCEVSVRATEVVEASLFKANGSGSGAELEIFARRQSARTMATRRVTPTEPPRPALVRRGCGPAVLMQGCIF